MLSNNDIVAIFNYNIEGIFYKILEDIIENTKANHYYLLDESTIVKKDEFRSKVFEYAQKLSKEEMILFRLFVQNEKLYVAYIESSILSFLDLSFDRFIVSETANLIELAITTDEEFLTN